MGTKNVFHNPFIDKSQQQHLHNNMEELNDHNYPNITSSNINNEYFNKNIDLEIQNDNPNINIRNLFDKLEEELKNSNLNDIDKSIIEKNLRNIYKHIDNGQQKQAEIISENELYNSRKPAYYDQYDTNNYDYYYKTHENHERLYKERPIVEHNRRNYYEYDKYRRPTRREHRTDARRFQDMENNVNMNVRRLQYAENNIRRSMAKDREFSRSVNNIVS